MGEFKASHGTVSKQNQHIFHAKCEPAQATFALHIKTSALPFTSEHWPTPLILNPFKALLAFLPVRNTSPQTITYQAVLTTDGFRSYILMLYQEGGMRWDYTRLAATNVLIGYTRYGRLSTVPPPPPSTGLHPTLSSGWFNPSPRVL